MRIRSRIIAGALAVTVAANVVYSLYFIDRERQLALSRLESTIRETSQLMGSVMAGPLYDGNVEQLRSALDSFFLNPDIVRIVLKEHRGDIEITRVREPAGGLGGQIARRVPIVRGIDDLGEIAVDFTTANIERRLVESRNELVLLSIASVLGLAAVILVVARGLTRPMDRLTEAARSMAEGRLDQEIAPGGAHEIRVLGQSFERMRDSIRRQMATLEEKNQQLGQEMAQRREAEQERDRLVSVVDATSDFVGVSDPHGRVLYLNRAAWAMSDLDPDQDLDTTISRLHPHWAADLITRLGIPAAVRDGSWSGETAIIGRDGREIPMSQVILSHKDAEGRLLYLSTIMRDIGELKRAAAALRIKDDAIAASINAIAFADLSGKLTYVNPAFLQMWGYERAEEVVGSSALEFWRDPGEVSGVLQTALSGGSWSGELAARRKDGSAFIALLSATAIRDAEGRTFQLMGSFLDVTERRRAEEALRLSDERLRQAVRTSQIGIYDDDHLAGTIYWSPEVRLIFGWGEEEDVTLAMFVSQIHGGDRERVGEAVRRAHDPSGDGLFEIEYRFVRRDGSVRWITTRARTQFAGDGDARRPVRTIGAALDITDRKTGEQALRELTAQLETRVRERTAELETANRELEAFSYSVSHDLRAPLRAIDGFSRVLLEDHSAQLDAEARSYLDRVRKAVQRMGTLIDDLLQLARVTRAEIRVTTVDLTRLAEEIVAEMRSASPERRIDITIAKGLVAPGDSRLLQIVLANLIGNAWKFTARTPESRIEVGMSRADGKDAYFVRDNGSGFDMKYGAKLFGAFQRLHSEREFPGTGIGLATVARIVHRHGGQVWAEAAPGEGATFYFTLQAPAG